MTRMWRPFDERDLLAAANVERLGSGRVSVALMAPSHPYACADGAADGAVKLHRIGITLDPGLAGRLSPRRASDRQQPLEELTIALERETKVLRGGVLASSPLCFEP